MGGLINNGTANGDKVYVGKENGLGKCGMRCFRGVQYVGKGKLWKM